MEKDYYNLETWKLWHGTKHAAKVEAAKRGMSLVAFIDLLVKLSVRAQDPELQIFHPACNPAPGSEGG